MREYKKYVNVLVFILILFAAFRLDYNPFIDGAVPVTNLKKDELYLEIEQKAATGEYKEAPQNAYIDRVYKKTPGRNGRDINVEKSYQRMKKAGVFQEELLIFDQIRPEIDLIDLESAPIYRGHPEKQMVSFMINVSWGSEHIPAILNTLQEHQVKANFFIEGKWARENPELVQMIVEKGHLVGNHAYNHPDMARLNNQEIETQIKQTNEILTAITGETPTYFTPPSGSFKDEVVKIASEEGMETILWTVDTIDWKKPSVSVMINRVNDNVHPGAIILMHPTPVIAEGLDELITLLKDKDFRLGRLDTLLSTER